MVLALAVTATLSDCQCLSPSISSGGIKYAIEFAPAEPAPQAQVPDLVRRKKPPLPSVGDILVFGGAGPAKNISATVEFYAPAKGAWTLAAKLLQARAGGLATELTTAPLSGEILIGGGFSGSVGYARGKLVIKAKAVDAELYNPATGAFASLGQLNDPRALYTQTLLPNGQVLIAGGIDATRAPTAKAELFDPATSTFSPIGDMNYPRALHSATLLADGTVLIVGGLTDAANDTLGNAEIYDPNSGTFTNVPQQITQSGFPVTLAGHTATLISGCNCALDGQVLIVDGYESAGVDTTLNSAFLYDPSNQAFTPTTTQPTDSRTFHSATPLANGDVLIAGGLTGQASIGSGRAFGVIGGALNSAEIFDPNTQSFTCVNGIANGQCAGGMVNSRAGHSATLMTSGPLAGDVLLAGGVGGPKATTRGCGAALATAEIFDPVAGKFKATGKMHFARGAFGSTPLE